MEGYGRRKRYREMDGERDGVKWMEREMAGKGACTEQTPCTTARMHCGSHTDYPDGDVFEDDEDGVATSYIRGHLQSHTHTQDTLMLRVCVCWTYTAIFRPLVEHVLTSNINAG
jgi:hypothetical protein